MRRVMLLFGAVLCLAVAATAQDNAVTFAPSQPAAAAAAPQGPLGGPSGDLQVFMGYQYNRLRFGSASYNTNGYNMSVVKYLHSRFGLEGDVGAGFGNTGTQTVPHNLVVKTVSVMGGAHVSLARDSRFEPWVHGLVGLEHIRFTQTIGPATFNSVGWTLGGGADFHFNPLTAVRIEGDYLGTHFNSVTQSNFQLLAGLVLNF